ncbi:MAG: carboxynorspermidine decarboxylase [Candidatus Nomurabacteria bacterium]|nr:carboxynorspermidine decarboxylase [Candidatus Nomurabacteria bacterium]
MSNKENIFIEPWIETEGWDKIDFSKIETPSYVVSLEKLENNLKILKGVEEKTGAHILMALKGFSMFSTFPLIKKYLRGSEASSVNEVRLGCEEFGKETHVFSPSYTDENIKEYIKYADHLVFNSFSQWNKFKSKCIGKVSCGLRVNLEHSEVETSMYDPSSEKSHFGVTFANFEKENITGLEGLHFHNLCELNADALARSLKVFEEKFGEFLSQMKWVNFGGGHHITRKDYDLELLYKILNAFKKKYPHLEVYLEPGEAVALNAGILAASVVDIFKNGINIAVLDVSATTHMPDVLEMPYLPSILDATEAKEGKEHNYRLVGPSCLTGDVIGEYSFNEPLKIGQKIVFLNMAIYTMVKNNTFNGVNLPNITTVDKTGKIKIIKKFYYKDFKNRLS